MRVRVRTSRSTIKLFAFVLFSVLCMTLLVKVWVDSAAFQEIPFEFATAYPVSSLPTQSRQYPRKYISIRLFGRLGNQLFQFAALLGQASALGYTPALGHPRSEFGLSILDVFNITEVRKVKILQPRMFVCGTAFFKSLPAEVSQYNVSMKGYCQSWKYFANISDIVRKSLSFKTPILSTARHFLDSNKKPGAVLVGIHIRRGDLLKQKLLDFGVTLPGKDYIRSARKYFQDKFTNVQFLVITDDPVWCSDNIIGDDVMHSPFTSPGEDLALMSLCDHMIITTSTFGWWGSFLAGGETIYYNDFPRPGSSLDRVFNKLDYYPPAWKAFS